ncbi:MAG TPA: FHA domain-containing protein [Myxococcales bacterium]|nr:FHA domain-containing protein [Myxococcales bacterium]
MRDLRGWASALGPEEFRRQVGPFVLIQRPPDPVLQQRAMALGAQRTEGGAEKRDRIGDLLLMIRGFDDLVVCTLPPLDASAELTVGRLPDCELIVEDPSVSKRHALLRWDTVQGGCSIQDLGSTNGTFVNANELADGEERLLADGDALAFGDPEFLYFLTESLHHQLAGVGLAKP